MEIACREESGEEEKWEARKRCNQVFQSYNSGRSSDSRSRGTQHAIHVRTHTHTHVHAATRAEPILFPILYPTLGIYILPRWPPADVPFNAAKMPEEKFLVALSPNLSPSSEHSRRPVFFQPFRAGIFGRNIYRTGRSSTIIIIIIAVPGNPHFHNHGHVRTRDTNNTGLCAGETGYLPRWSVTDIANF